MSRPRLPMLRIFIPLVIFLFGCFTPQRPPDDVVRPDRANIVVMGDAYHLAPGSVASFLVQVRDPARDRPLANRRVEIGLRDATGAAHPVFAGTTDDDGLTKVAFQVPDTGSAPEQLLEIAAEAVDGQFFLQQDTYVGRVYDVLLSTDKPVYQPGQTIHMRGLALDTLSLSAADAQTMTLTVEDPRGNKLARTELLTSEFGVASTDFALDSQAISGDYILTAQVGPTRSTRSVEVKPYTLPRFEIIFQPDKTFYLPGELATGTVEARYFFGKPVAGADVILRATTNDAAEVTLGQIDGQTDADGIYRYEFHVPDYFVGQLDNKTAQVDLEIQVFDTANHAETIDESITVAERALLIDAVPESGMLQPGLENRIYLDASYPDGRVAEATLAISGDVGEPITVTTDVFGLAVITVTPPSQRFVALQVDATDAEGRSITQPLLLGSDIDASTNVLLRPERAEYKVGETASIDIYVSGNATTAYLDVVKGRQTFGIAALPVQNGVAQAALPIDGSLLGTLELNAYVVGDNGEIVRDRRLLLVNPAAAEISVTTDAEVYRPGDTATLDIQVQREGAPMPGVIGLAIVDESVFSVREQEPGFARTYFLLERELQEPRYEIHDFVPMEDDTYSPYDDRPESIKYARQSSQEMIAQMEIARQVALTGLFARTLADEQIAEKAPAQPASAPSPLGLLAFWWGNRIFLFAPLVGLALYNGTRKRRNLLIALIVLALGAFVWSACGAPAAPAPAAAPALEAAPQEAAGATTATQGEEPPRLRQYFPETLFWMPELETDAEGRVQVEVPIADSITTWRVSVLASDQQGNLGSAETDLRVFQEFFVEPDLPRFLTVGDEIAVPVSIFNYLDEAQTIALDVAPGDWFTFSGAAQQILDVDAAEVTVAYVPIQVTRHGTFEFQVTASGTSMSDAVARAVEVLPDGQQVVTAENGRLKADQTFAVGVPPSAITDTGRLRVRIYPGITSQVLEGLEGMLQMPYGCFEQTSSITYPNILILDYLKQTDQANPRIQLQAEQLINLGYQRLLTFEVSSQPGGFSLFGEPPAETLLTAYGMLEFGDMAGVSYVDPELLERVFTFLSDQQRFDGAWDPQGMTIESGLEDMNGEVATTAYIVWGLADAGYDQTGAVSSGVSYLLRTLPESPIPAETPDAAATTAGQPESPLVEPGQVESPLAVPKPAVAGGYDVYTLALVANALVASDVDATPVLDQLAEQAQAAEDTAFWLPGMNTYMGSYGYPATLETTAMVAQAFLRANYRPDLAQGALNFLIENRDPNGSFYTTQATIQALKALILAAEAEDQGRNAIINVTLTDESGEVRMETILVDESNRDVVQQVAFEGLIGAFNDLQITVDGDDGLQYQVLTSYYAPWPEGALEPASDQPMRVSVTYDRTELTVNDTVQAQAEVELLAPGRAGTVIVDLGIPPGFTPVTADLDALVEAGQIERYELTGRQIILYLTDVETGRLYTLPYRLQARYPIRAQTPASEVYDYYAPDQRATDAPQRIVVTLGTPTN